MVLKDRIEGLLRIFSDIDNFFSIAKKSFLNLVLPVKVNICRGDDRKDSSSFSHSAFHTDSSISSSSSSNTSSSNSPSSTLSMASPSRPRSARPRHPNPEGDDFRFRKSSSTIQRSSLLTLFMTILLGAAMTTADPNEPSQGEFIQSTFFSTTIDFVFYNKTIENYIDYISILKEIRL